MGISAIPVLYYLIFTMSSVVTFLSLSVLFGLFLYGVALILKKYGPLEIL